MVTKCLATLGFCHEEQTIQVGKPSTMDRKTYAQTFGPTVGDRIRLGDTELIVEIEYDACAGPDGACYGDEVKFGGTYVACVFADYCDPASQPSLVDDRTVFVCSF